MSNDPMPDPDRDAGGLSPAADVLQYYREEILSDYKRRLGALGSPLLADSHAAGQLEAQARAIIEDAAGLLRGEIEPSQEKEQFSGAVGASRAKERVHPSKSLQAALELSEAALSVLYQELQPDCPETMMQVASAVHRCTLERVMRASISYVEHLLGEVQESQTRERRRLGRELHDRVASSLAVVYQNLELVEVLKDKDPPQAGKKLELIRGMTREALDSVGDLSAELRRSVGREGLEAALSDLLPILVPEDVEASVSIKGDETPVPDYVKEELFLILREAIINAASYSGAGRIRIELSTEQDLIQAEILDDGQGFDPEGEEFTPGTGIESMTERANLLGGSFRLNPEQGTGTRVEVRVPLERGRSER